MEDTICAISTAPGIGAISIVRVSGKNAIEIVSKILVVVLKFSSSSSSLFLVISLIKIASISWLYNLFLSSLVSLVVVYDKSSLILSITSWLVFSRYSNDLLYKSDVSW